jgi:hypothetical protein
VNAGGYHGIICEDPAALAANASGIVNRPSEAPISRITDLESINGLSMSTEDSAYSPVKAAVHICLDEAGPVTE